MSYCGDPYELQPTLFTYKMKKEKQLASVQIIMINKHCKSPVTGAAKIKLEKRVLKYSFLHTLCERQVKDCRLRDTQEKLHTYRLGTLGNYWKGKRDTGETQGRHIA